MSNGVINYYAVALNPEGKIGQLLVKRVNGKPSGQIWTGKTYPSMAAARKDLVTLNCGGA